MRIVVAAAAIMLLAANTSHAQLRIQGTTISLTPAPGFSLSTDFAGLVNTETNANLLVTEFPLAAYDEIAALFVSFESLKTSFAPKGVAIDKLEQLDLAVGKVPVATGTQSLGGVTLDKWMVLIKSSRTVLLTVQAPQEARLDTAVVKQMLGSIVLQEPSSVAEKLAALPFTIQVAAPFRVIDTIGGVGVMLTVGPLDTDPTQSQPSIIIAYQQVPALAGSDAEAVSEMVLRSIQGFADARVAGNGPIALAGVNGVRTRGIRNAKGGERQFIYDFAIWRDGRNIVLIATVDEPRMPELQASIDTIAQSIALKRN